MPVSRATRAAAAGVDASMAYIQRLLLRFPQHSSGSCSASPNRNAGGTDTHHYMNRRDVNHEQHVSGFDSVYGETGIGLLQGFPVVTRLSAVMYQTPQDLKPADGLNIVYLDKTTFQAFTVTFYFLFYIFLSSGGWGKIKL